MKQKGILIDRGNKKLSLHDLILSAFRKEFGDIIIGVNLQNLAHECWATVVVKDKSLKIERRAQEIEREFGEELGRHISIFIKVPLKNRLKNWFQTFRKGRGTSFNN